MWLGVSYLLLSSVLSIHTLFQFWLWLAARRGSVGTTDAPVPAELPRITIQLPIFNERYVVRALLDVIAQLDYPWELLEVQVLDDSTDDTAAVLADACRELAASGLAITHVRRGTRQGYKAGALAYGLARANGELVAVFDADSRPAPDFLRRTVPRFTDPRVAAVQTRWSHVNRDELPITQLQGLLLDVHFAVDQAGRAALGCFVNFNGTAGIWRVAAITDAGGWQSDTLTEDLDLSYRAQLRGWRIELLLGLETMAELPSDVRAFRTQQYRWMKGVAQNAVKLGPRIIAARLPLRVKAHALAHLLEPANFVAMAGVLLLTPWAVHAVALGVLPWWVVLNPLWALNVVLLGAVYFAPRKERAPGLRGKAGGLVLWVAFLAVSLAMSLRNALAVLAGFLGLRSGFVRTPKRGDGPAIASGAYSVRLDGFVLGDLALWVYLAGSLVAAGRIRELHLCWVPALAFVGLTALLVGQSTWFRSPRTRLADRSSRTAASAPRR
jgi:cellulose synthase/poly-beta-1,6-N-acetylglucosamine synthase-like glycosyltransferase